MEFTAVKRHEYKSIRQPLSGYQMGYESSQTWAVELRIGKSSMWQSMRSYKSFEAAHRAAQRLNKKHAPTTQ